MSIKGRRTGVGPDGVNLKQAKLRRADLFGLIEDRGDGLDIIFGRRAGSPPARLGLTELHDLVYVEDGLLDDAGDRSVDPGQARKPDLIQDRAGENAQLALEFQEVIELALVGQLVDELGRRSAACPQDDRSTARRQPSYRRRTIAGAGVLVELSSTSAAEISPVLDGSSRRQKNLSSRSARGGSIAGTLPPRSEPRPRTSATFPLWSSRPPRSV